jgi:hypothetical protein
MQAAPMTVRTANLMRQPVIEFPACESLACAVHQGSFEASYHSRETFTAGSSDAVVRPRSVIDQCAKIGGISGIYAKTLSFFSAFSHLLH